MEYTKLARSHIAMVLIPVLAAGALLARVTANLLDNSRKYGGRENVRVAISARAAGEQAELAFTDNGPGVPPEQLPHLFEQFWRGDQARSSRGGEGSGLGLYIVKTILEQHKEKISVTSEDGVTTFSFSLATE